MLEVPRLRHLIETMQGQQVVMLVDLVADRFLYGSAERVSREAPVLILQHETEETLLGGGGNAVANVCSLGGRPRVLGRVGNDAVGRRLLERFAELEIETSGILVVDDFETPVKTRILGGAQHTTKQQIVRYDRGQRRGLDSHDVREVESRLRAMGRERDIGPAVAVLSDYGYGFVDPCLVGSLRATLGDGALLIADSRHALASFSAIDAATPNQEEAEELIHRALASKSDLVESGQSLLARVGVRYLLVTRGSRGMVLFERHEEASSATFIPAVGGQQIADVTGAGDTVIGTFALALAAAASPVEAAVLANLAASVVVSKAGTATVARGELLHALEQGCASLQHFEVGRLGHETAVRLGDRH